MEQAAARGFTRHELATPSFSIFALAHTSPMPKTLRVYIEGDGNAWIDASLPSPDPTPLNPLALQLALQDNAADVLYLARPCQYITSPSCDIPAWTDARFTADKVEAMHAAMLRFPAQSYELVGYSGGGAIALLIAAREPKVSSVRSVAGNLMPDYFSELHGVSPMQGTFPLAFRERLSSLPQQHFYGTNDTIVPPAIAQRYAQTLSSPCVTITPVDATHNEGWKNWGMLLATTPSCGQ